MEDDLVLNLVDDSQQNSSKLAHTKKGGKWTDRLKAKRVAKRTIRYEEKSSLHTTDQDVQPPPAKRARKGPPRGAQFDTTNHTANSNRIPNQIISSLFSYNPKVDEPAASTAFKPVGKPSNAPLTDSSTFTGLGLDPLIVSHLSTKMNITKPTSIQRASLPTLLSAHLSSGDSFRDVFIQSQTGSGKTLSFLLPILQDLLPLSSLSYIDRSIGTLAIIIAPTRELANQISDVLGILLKLRLRPADDPAEDSSSPRLTRWLVSGLLTGGTTRAHEKARLRKGLPILVSTPGRLLDHLQKTSAFNVGKCRWLVLDEADRLMELGFEETITGIIKGLDGSRKLALQAVQEGKSSEVGGWDWDRQRRTILCSATIREDVQKLAGTTLKDPIVIKTIDLEEPVPLNSAEQDQSMIAPPGQKFTPPSQLSQKYIIVALKLRLVALVSLLRSLLAASQSRKGTTKIIIFLSCTDSVDFHWELLGNSSMEDRNEDDKPDSHDNTEGEEPKRVFSRAESIEVQSPLLPLTSIYRLHGSLAQPTRLASLRGFSCTGGNSSILLCTSVASRGLDLPLVRAVIQYDLPTEGGATEYVHRVGRTARAGKGGEAWTFVSPSEKDWVSWVEGKMRGSDATTEPQNIKLESVAVDSVLRKGFGGKGIEYEGRATEVQLAFERWVLKDRNAELARRAFTSHTRAYATHPSDEKHIFHVRHLHLGHLAKSFALREAPTTVSNHTSRNESALKVKRPMKDRSDAAPRDVGAKFARRGKDWEEERDVGTERRMQKAVRAQGKLSKRKGVLMSFGGSEFQIASGDALERLVNGKG